MAEPKVSMCRAADVTIKSFHFEPVQSKDGSITYHTVDNDDEVVPQEFCETGETNEVIEKLKNLVNGFCTGIDPKTGKSLVDDTIFHTTCAVSNEYPEPPVMVFRARTET